MVWKASDPQGDEASKIRWHLVPYTRGRGLDLGCGPHKAFEHFTGVDNGSHGRMFGWQFQADVIVDTCERLPGFATEGWDFVFSSHLLEHIEDYESALAEWWRLIKHGGHLVLYLPHKRFYPNIGQPGANPDHAHDFMPRDIIDAMMKVAPGWDLIENEDRNEGREYSFFQVYRKREDKRCVIHGHPWKKPGTKMVCIVRYGGFGDCIQTSSILPALKEDGWHITVMTTPKGKDILDGNPHIDRFILQDGNPDQVPNAELPQYWAAWKQKFDRWINLSESVEGTLLAIPGRINHAWPQQLRHQMLDVNYYEFTHQLAEVPLPPKPAFYPTDADLEWCLHNVLPLDGFLIMWAMAGSSVHKAYPHMDNVIARIMRAIPEAKVILVGDAACQVLEAGWEQEPRVIRTAGKWSIRQTLTAARECNIVVGPETGVLNSVAFIERVGKIVMLSHSSVENLTKGWLNTDAMVPDVPCHPCHRLHYGREFCPEWRVPVKNHPVSRDPKLMKEMTDGGHIVDGLFATGASLCAAAINPDDICELIERRYEAWRTHRAVATAG